VPVVMRSCPDAGRHKRLADPRYGVARGLGECPADRVGSADTIRAAAVRRRCTAREPPRAAAMAPSSKFPNAANAVRRGGQTYDATVGAVGPASRGGALYPEAFQPTRPDFDVLVAAGDI
jgi:hypothetical protein